MNFDLIEPQKSGCDEILVWRECGGTKHLETIKRSDKKESDEPFDATPYFGGDNGER